MKTCPTCNTRYDDNSLNYCLNDGTELGPAEVSGATEETVVLDSSTYSAQPTISMAPQPTRIAEPVSYAVSPPAGVHTRSRSWVWALLVLGGLILLCGGGGLIGLFVYTSNQAANTNRSSTISTRSSSPEPSKSDSPSAETGEYKLTLAQYNQLKDGMQRAEVERILGGKGKQLSSSSAADTTYTVDEWEGENYSSIILSFENDKVTSRAQAGLK